MAQHNQDLFIISGANQVIKNPKTQTNAVNSEHLFKENSNIVTAIEETVTFLYSNIADLDVELKKFKVDEENKEFFEVKKRNKIIKKSQTIFCLKMSDSFFDAIE